MKNLFLLLLIILSVSCRKTDIEADHIITFPSDLYITKINKKSGLRLFAGGVEIKNQAVINSFIKRHGGFGIKDSVVVSNEKITFISPDTLHFGSATMVYSVYKKDDQFIFKSKNKLILPANSYNSIKNLYKYTDESPELVYNGNYRLNSFRVAYGNYAQLDLSVLSYKTIASSPFATDYFDNLGAGAIFPTPPSYYVGNIFNEFNENFIRSGRSSDTLAVEEYSYTFKIKNR